MASTNQVVLGFAFGEDEAAPEYRIRLSAGPGPQLSQESAERERTGNTRDGGETVVTGRSVGGSFSMILQAMTAPMLYYGVLGGKSVTGSGPYNHHVFPASDQPWMTWWRFWGGEIAEKFTGCKLISHSTTGGAEQNNGDIVGEFGIVGKDAEYLTSLPYDPYDISDAGAGVFDVSPVIRWPGYDITLDAVDDEDVRQFTHAVNADQNAVRTKYLTNSRIEPGRRTSTLTYTKVYTDPAEYRLSAYGARNAVTPTDVVALMAWDSMFSDSSGTDRFGITVPKLGLTEPTELPVTTDGAIGELAFGGGVQLPDAGEIFGYDFVNSVASFG